VGGQEEQPCDWKSSIMVRGSSLSQPVAVRACWLLLSPDAANTVKGAAVLCEKKFLRVSIFVWTTEELMLQRSYV